MGLKLSARRVSLITLVGAGWLSILGNSPPPNVRRQVTRQSGDITIALDSGPYATGDGCPYRPRVFTPVRRFALFSKGQLAREISCVDGSDCLLFLPLSGDVCQALPALPDAGGADVAGSDGPGNSGDGFTGSDAAVIATDASAPPPGGPAIISCPRPGSSPIQLQVMNGSSSSGCEDNTSYKMEVQTAAGAISTIEYKIEIDEPPGYFGCD